MWVFQTASIFADADLFAKVLCALVLLWLLSTFEGEGGATFALRCLTAGLLRVFASIGNSRDEEKASKENAKETPPPEERRRPKRTGRSRKRAEDKKPGTLKEKTKMYPSLETCKKLNRDSRSIYECLLAYKLSEEELLMNHYPDRGYRPRTLVEEDDSTRHCVRCNGMFEIYRGVYLSPTKCEYHPRKATFNHRSGRKIHACCDSEDGAPPCALADRHVTLQHGPRELTSTPSRRHVRRDLQNRVFGLDCEMSYTTGGLEVTRIGVVDLDGRTVYSAYVRPRHQVLDYNTQFSGVERRHLERETTTTDDVRSVLSALLQEDTVLVGHALNNDLAALGLIHKTVVDTSVLFADGARKRSLRSLASEHLGASIQEGASGHDCIEDARAALQLALLKVPAGPARQPQRLPRESTLLHVGCFRPYPAERGVCFGL